MKKIYYFLFSILAVAATSCSDDLDIKPTSFISDATVWEDQALINKYVANIYGSMLCGFNRCTAGYGQDWSMSWAGNLDGGTDDIAVVAYSAFDFDWSDCTGSDRVACAELLPLHFPKGFFCRGPFPTRILLFRIGPHIWQGSINCQGTELGRQSASCPIVF